MDTRAFWLDCLQKVERYVEVDVETIQTYKNSKLEELKVEPLCSRQIIVQDFSKESTKDLTNHGYDATIPTCWILEGLIFYLKE